MMNHNGENELTGSGSDPVVSAEYRAVAIERTPPKLNSAVIKAARAAARGSGLQGFTASWFRPLAFAASLGLALALLLETTSTDYFPWILDPESSSVGPSDSAPATAEEEQISSEFSEMIEASSKRMREQDVARDAIIQSLSEPGAIEIVTLENVARLCTKEQTAGPATWWQCISELDDAGRHDDARAEMEFLQRAHPNFKAPETLPSQ